MGATKTEIDLLEVIIKRNRSFALWLDLIVRADSPRIGYDNTETAEELAESLRQEANDYERQLIDIAKENAK